MFLTKNLDDVDRGERPDYEVVLAAIDYFKDYPDSYHHPKEDMIFERLKVRDAAAAAMIGALEAEHQEGARRLRRVAQTIEAVLRDEDLLRHTVHDIMRTLSTTNGNTWLRKSACCFRLRSTHCSRRIGQKSL